MDIIQSFYNGMASQYHKLFADWQSTTREQADILDKIFKDCGFQGSTRILDCACGIGTQSIGLAALGYSVAASDISEEEIKEARNRATAAGLNIDFKCADFRALGNVYSENFDIIIAMDNALPHMLSKEDLNRAIESITERMARGGIFVASIRDYDVILEDKPPYSPPYIHKTSNGRRVSFQTWDWDGDKYKLTQYIIEDGETVQASKFQCEYRATRRDELTELLIQNGCREVDWKFPNETGFYQPILIAKK